MLAIGMLAIGMLAIGMLAKLFPRLPTPDSRLPTPDSRLPTAINPERKYLTELITAIAFVFEMST